MEKWFCCLLISLLAGHMLSAQHCPYDYATIVVVYPHLEGDSTVLSNLRITVWDSLNQPLMRSRWNGKVWEKDTVSFWVNPKRTTRKGVIDNNHPMEPWKMHFWFAEGNYVLVGGGYPKGFTLQIEDGNRDIQHRRWRTQRIPLNPSQMYPLCTGHSSWDHHWDAHRAFVKGYTPIEVIMEEI
ncbi:MAG: hypothetical protein AAFV07_16075 [Bacteroidota bacterium]